MLIELTVTSTICHHHMALFAARLRADPGTAGHCFRKLAILIGPNRYFYTIWLNLIYIYFQMFTYIIKVNSQFGYGLLFKPQHMLSQVFRSIWVCRLRNAL